MGLFSNLFDKREKMVYCRGCDFLFQIALLQKVQFPITFSDITENEYRCDIVGIVMAYLDTKPQGKCVRVRSTFGKDAIYYGTVHSEREFKEVYVPKYKEKHSYYSNFISSNMNNNLNATTARTLAMEVCRVNHIELDDTKINTIIVDINVMTEIVDATLSTYRFVDL